MLPESARSVLRLLAAEGPSTRPALAQRLGLSKPTMSAVMTTLTAQDLLICQGEAKGATGRSAKVYALGPRTGYVVGLDIGTTRVRVLASRLDGETVCEFQRPVPGDEGAEGSPSDSVAVAAELLDLLINKLGDSIGPPRAAAAAMSALIRPTGAPDRDGDVLATLRQPLPDGVSLHLENNVNCAAIAEQTHGAATGRESFVYLQVGVKIGLGIVANNRLLRGAGGGAGEVGNLTFPWAATETASRGDLERYLGSAALLRRVREGWPPGASPAPSDTADLFARAGAGEDAARHAVKQHARDLGGLVNSIVAVLDPGLVVMGGGVGQNPALLPEIRSTVRRLSWPTEVEVSSLGQDATLLGAVHIATRHGMKDLLDGDA